MQRSRPRHARLPARLPAVLVLLAMLWLAAPIQALAQALRIAPASSLRVASAGSMGQEPAQVLAQLEAQQGIRKRGGAIAVVFPDIGEPYRSVFAQIVKGIEQRASVPVQFYPVRSGADYPALGTAIKRNGAGAVIALGRQGTRAASSLALDIPTVVGGVLSVPEQPDGDITAITLAPDPALLFAQLRSMLPAVRRVTVIYDPRQNDWLIRRAREAARMQGLELVAQEAHDRASAARMYETAFSASESRRDAVWLPQDATTVDEVTILPLVLRESWNRSVPVFSSSFLHAKRGALFSLYPDNLELGRSLAAAADAAMKGEVRPRGVEPLRAVQIAVNLRTASHLGLQFDYQQQRVFDLTFPEP